MRKLLCLVLILVGCGQQPTGPDPFDTPRPSLDGGRAHVQWIVASSDCARCATSVLVDNQRQLRVVVIESDQFSIFATEIKEVEWQQAWELVAPVVAHAQRQGCDADLPEESFAGFSGDAGVSSRVEGCDAPDVERAREHLRSLVRRYLPDVRP